MASARIWVFNVEQGFCAFIRSPNGGTLMIDCGRAKFFSPALYLMEHEFSAEKLSSENPLTTLIITHPHDDHIRDIERVTQRLKPIILVRNKYNWQEVEEGSGGDYENLRLYADFQDDYYIHMADPDWGGMKVSSKHFGVEEAKRLNASKFVNNSSIITAVEIGTFKMVFTGDIEKDCWLEMLKRKDFCEILAGADVFVASHHGHSSGYVSDVFDVMGRPQFNLVSCHHRDESVESAYSSPSRARGVQTPRGETPRGETRYMFTTRHDGSCLIQVAEDGRSTYGFYALPDNLQ